MGAREEQASAVEKATVQELKKNNSMPSEKEVTLKDLARIMAGFAADREWDSFHSPRNLLLALVSTSPLIQFLFLFLLTELTAELLQIAISILLLVAKTQDQILC